MKSKGYSLWLMPREELYHKFANLIKKLAKKYNAPKFEPHITLLGQIFQSEKEVLKRAQ